MAVVEGQTVLSYHNSLLKESDLLLLQAPNWLNDKIIGFYFEYLENAVFLDDKDKVCFVSPDVTQFIKLYEGPEIGIFLEPLMLSEKELVVLAINSNASLTDSGGTHWSTLVFERSINSFKHYDSCCSINHEEALKCSSKLTTFLNVPSISKHTEMECPQQHNSHDCGVYCALFAQYAASAKLHRDPKVLEEFVTKETVSKWRTETQTLIKSLSVN